MECNAEIQKALHRAGGSRLNGDPLYKFMWSGDFTYLISNGKTYEPFRVVAQDCWLLVKFEYPDFWGTQAEWEMNNWEGGQKEVEVNGVMLLSEPLYTAGPYPRNGRYRNLMRIKRSVMLGGTEAFVDCVPSLEWVRDVFPGVRDFQELPTEKKAEFLRCREIAHREKLAKDFGASRELYRGIATATQVKKKVEAIERFLADPKRIKNALQTKRRRR